MLDDMITFEDILTVCFAVLMFFVGRALWVFSATKTDEDENV